MRILHIYKDYFPVRGGIENHVRLLAEAQAARAHEVTVLVTSRDRHSHGEWRNGVRILFGSRLMDLSSAPLSVELFQRAAEWQGDIIHLHSPYPVGELAYFFGSKTRAAVLTYHSDIVRQKIMGALYTPLWHRVLARVNTIIATSPVYVETSPVLARHRKKCIVVPLGIPPPSRVAEHIDVPPTELLFVGKLRYYKGVNDLLQALAQISDARLTIVGSGPMEAEWKALAASLNLAARVTWAGEVSDDALAAYYDACEIFVLPCSERSEAFGAVQLEAMAAGKPIVSCDVHTGVAWVNQNEITGLIVPPKNSAALAQAITRLLNNAPLRARMGSAGRERFAREFTLDKMVERVLRVYEIALAV
jgi:rhamnosyl/mannosyltransferase